MSNETNMQSDERVHENRPAQIAGDESLSATKAAAECFKAYSKERPEVIALWAFGIGFVLGWKLKPW